MAGMDDTVGQRLVAARKEMGMKQVEVAELIHVSERTMHAYESDEVVPFRKLRELSEVLGRPMAWILHGDKAEQTPGDLGPQLSEILVVLEEIRDALKPTEPASKPRPRAKTKTKTTARPRKRS
jgi:transcriptional regulator with XRE-family HTH domain